MSEQAEPDAEENGKLHPSNELNELTGKQWIKFTRSWFVADSRRYWRNKPTELHPARFPEEMVRDFVEFFTKSGQWVLDPFLGSGATLVTCSESGRNAVGIELNPRYAGISRERLAQESFFSRVHVLEGDARDVRRSELWRPLAGEGLDFAEDELPKFDYIITSPPYWQMLRASRGGVESTQKKRAASGLDTHYSDDPRDLGNIEDYDEFVEAVGRVFDSTRCVLKEGKYLTVVMQNVRTPERMVRPLAWDIASRLSQTFSFQGERIWCQNTKMLGIWGYPRVFVPNYHHHYCLIFRHEGS